MGRHTLLQGSFPTQGSNPCLLCPLHCRGILYLGVLGSPQGIPRKEYGKSIAVQKENCSLVIVGVLLVDRIRLPLSAVVQAPQVEKGCENEKVLNI